MKRRKRRAPACLQSGAVSGCALKEDCFKKKRRLVVHVAIALGKGKLLHILNGCESRIENSYISAQ